MNLILVESLRLENEGYNCIFEPCHSVRDNTIIWFDLKVKFWTGYFDYLNVHFQNPHFRLQYVESWCWICL